MVADNTACTPPINPHRVEPAETKTRQDVVMQRLQAKLAKRDKRIAGLEQRIAKLERALAGRTLDLESLSRNLERTVTNALCNVRMIPVFGVGQTNKIVEIRGADA